MLSQPDGDYRLSYADRASRRLEVVVDPTTKANVLVEQMAKPYGIYTHIYQLINGRYIDRACVMQNGK